MIIIDTALEQREREGHPIKVAVLGAGYMGAGIAQQINMFTPGMVVAVVANRNEVNGASAMAQAGIDEFERADDQDAIDRAVDAGRAVLTTNHLAATRSPVDCVVEVTGTLELAANWVSSAIENRKHVVLVNAELDATVGPILNVLARRNGVILSNADGDEPAVAMNLFRFMKTGGYTPVVIGNLKGFYDRKRTPETQRGFADKHGQRPFTITSFADGTKLSLESTVLANATGYTVSRRGMEGPAAGHVRDAVDLFDLEAARERPIVDFLLGAEPGSGVFAVGYNPDPYLRAKAAYFKMGAGPYHVFHRPFHLTHVEAPLTVARAVDFNDAAIAAASVRCEVASFAKRDLEPGAELDGIGGFDLYGMVDDAAQVASDDILPIGLSQGARLIRAVAEDEPVRMSDVELPPGRTIDALRLRQYEHFGVGAR